MWMVFGYWVGRTGLVGKHPTEMTIGSFPEQITQVRGGDRAEDLLWDWVGWSKSSSRKEGLESVAFPFLCFGCCCPIVWTGVFAETPASQTYNRPFPQLDSIAQF